MIFKKYLNTQQLGRINSFLKMNDDDRVKERLKGADPIIIAFYEAIQKGSFRCMFEDDDYVYTGDAILSNGNVIIKSEHYSGKLSLKLDEIHPQ